MNQEKQRIAIAAACGWEQSPDGKKWRIPYRSSYRFRRKIGDQFYYTNEVPDYLNSLDAMHRAVHTLWTLDPYFGQAFSIKLTEVVTGLAYSAQVAAECLEDMITATAAQRAEAFLKTLGLWTEEE